MVNRLIAGACLALGLTVGFSACSDSQEQAEIDESVNTTPEGPALTDSDSSSDGSTTGSTAEAGSSTSDPPAENRPVGINRESGFIVVLDETTGEVVAVDLESGSVDQVLATMSPRARGVGRLQLAGDGTLAVFDTWPAVTEGSCDEPGDAVVALDLTSGGETLIGAGGQSQVSPDGRRVAFLAASACLADPLDPDLAIDSALDTVVVRDLFSGEEHQWERDSQGDSASSGDSDEAGLGGLVWLGNDELAVAGYRLSASPLQVLGVGPNLGPESGSTQRILGLEESDGLVLVERVVFSTDGERVELVGVDPETGEASPYASSRSTRAAFALDSSGNFLAVLDDGALQVDGRTVQLDIQAVNFDW